MNNLITPSQELHERFRAILQKRIDGCRCGGTRCNKYASYECEGCSDGSGCDDETKDVCPTCTPWRELVKKYSISVDHYFFPDLTQGASALVGPRFKIVDMLDEMNLWDKFEHWMWNECGSCQQVKVYIDASLLLNAVIAFLKEVE